MLKSDRGISWWRISLAVAILMSTVSCGSTQSSSIVLQLNDVEFERPAPSGEPHLTSAAGDRALLTWLEPVDEAIWALRLVVRDGGEWSTPQTIHSSDQLFVNWADFPSSVEMADGSIIAHWLERSADARYAYHVMLSLSSDGGVTWSEPFRAHDDTSPTEHGFVSLVPWNGGAALVWLDGRAMWKQEEDEGLEVGAMSVRFRTVDSEGILGPEVLLDDRTCECCQTALARGNEGLIAAYRDRSMEEIRDIAIVRGGGEHWSNPSLISQDGWEVPGCPVNGPQLSAIDESLVATWYTGVGGDPKAYVAFSEDGGATFGRRIRIDEGLPLGRLDVEQLDDGSAVVVWLEASDDSPRVMARRVTASGELDMALVISETSQMRASGFPRMTRVGDELLLAWTLADEEGGIRVRSVRLTE